MVGPKGTGEQSRTWLTGAREAVDHVPADAIVHAGVALTLIHVHLAVCPRVALVEREREGGRILLTNTYRHHLGTNFECIV